LFTVEEIPWLSIFTINQALCLHYPTSDAKLTAFENRFNQPPEKLKLAQTCQSSYNLLKRVIAGFGATIPANSLTTFTIIFHNYLVISLSHKHTANYAQAAEILCSKNIRFV
jgi:hypothetical protein